MPDRELPDGWRRVRLGEILQLKYGSSLPESARQTGDIPVVGSAGVVGRHSSAAVKGPGIVVGRKGSIGRVIWLNSDFWPIDTTYYVEPVEFECYLPWAYQLLKTLNLAGLNRATGVPGLNRDDVHALMRDVPQREEQCRIAEVLGAIDAAIEKTESVIEATERLRSALLHELLTRGVPGWHTEWKQVPLRDVLARVIDHRGLTPKKVGGQFSETGVPVISAINIRSERVVLDEETRYVSEEMYSRWMAEELQREDVVLTSEAPLGSVAFLEEHYRFCLGQRLFALRADSSHLLPKFLYYALLSPAVQLELRTRATGTTATGIRQSELLKVTISVPDLDYQQQVVNLLTSMERRLNTERDYLSLVRIGKRFLSAALLSGRVRVKEKPRG